MLAVAPQLIEITVQVTAKKKLRFIDCEAETISEAAEEAGFLWRQCVITGGRKKKSVLLSSEHRTLQRLK